ncbi:MAG: DUF433 domain-containing protein [Pirellulales bacterium]|nr:DUF433 domain-containing protein [Pirellulales bacterium]
MSTDLPNTPRIDKEHIVMTPGVCGGKPRIAGTRIKVQYVRQKNIGLSAPNMEKKI